MTDRVEYLDVDDLVALMHVAAHPIDIEELAQRLRTIVSRGRSGGR